MIILRALVVFQTEKMALFSVLLPMVLIFFQIYAESPFSKALASFILLVALVFIQTETEALSSMAQ